MTIRILTEAQYQQVVEALEPNLEMEDGSVDVDVLRSLTILRSLEPVEPFVWAIELGDVTCFKYSGYPDYKSTPLYAAPKGDTP